MPHHVVVSFVVDEDGVRLVLHFLHSSVTDLLRLLPVTDESRRVVHRAVLRRARPLMEALNGVREIQKSYERSAAREARQMGCVRGLRAYVDPVVLHDINTIYLGLAGAMFGGGCWFRASSPCDECGNNEWSLTSTPPVVTGSSPKRLRRQAYEVPVGFCWTCLAQRPISVLEVACGWQCLGVPSFL